MSGLLIPYQVVDGEVAIPDDELIEDNCYVRYEDSFYLEYEGLLRRVTTIEEAIAELPPVEWACAMLKWRTTLDASVLWHLDYYMGHGYADINCSLRRVEDPADALFNQALITAPSLPRSMVVYRYHSLEPVSGHYQGYLSTSYSAALVFSRARNYKRSVSRIVVPAGSKAIYTYSHESEIILPHNTLMKVNGSRIQNGVTVYDVDVIVE